MLIGKRGVPTTSICKPEADRIEVRGRDLCADLLGQVTFSQYYAFLVTGKIPNADQSFFLDLLLVTIAEHGLVPSVQAARMTYRAAPDALQGAVAAGVLGCGSVILGTASACARALIAAREHVNAGLSPDEAARLVLEAIHAQGEPAPGFGHPLHRAQDPRAARVLELADERGVAGIHIDIARRMTSLVQSLWGRSLPMNASMAIAAGLLDVGLPMAFVEGVPILARTAGLLAHLAEEQTKPIGFVMAHHAEEAVAYDNC
ncbi:MAG: citryl-CoA lyase [Sphingobium sp.]|nr:citryl-CoA lyase [Sphingobium sp.]